MSEEWISNIQWNEQGLVPVIAQDHLDKSVLMVAWMNQEALQLTVDSGQVVYYSRSRQSLWRKGESSGNEQKVVGLYIDCDNDVLLVEVEQKGGIACHTGRKSCFFKKLENKEWQENQPVLKDPVEMYGDKKGVSGTVLEQLADILESRKRADASSSYVARLFAAGEDEILKKVGEEAVETILAAKENDNEHLIYETADLWFHTLVLLSKKGLHPQDVLTELDRRFGTSGLVEKASRNESK